MFVSSGVDRAQYHWHKQKPYYEIGFAVPEPRKDRPEPSGSNAIYRGRY